MHPFTMPWSLDLEFTGREKRQNTATTPSQ